MDLYKIVYRREPGEIERIYFSEQNICLMQKYLIDRIKREIGVTISRQNDDDVLGFMFEIYNIYSPSLTNKGSGNKVISTVNYLNDLALNKLVYNAKNGIIAYYRYVEDASKMHVPPSRGISTTVDKSLAMRL